MSAVGAVAILLLVVAVAQVARRLGIAAPLVLVVVGIGLSFPPFIPDVRLSPEVVLDVVLPVLLYASAVQVPIIDFRRSFKAIFSLSVVLVFATAFATALLLVALIPGVPFGIALAIGAVVSPTDAVAATSIAKRLGLPARLVTILEGESLVNDASGLSLLRSALATTGAGLSVGGVVGSFAYSVAVAVAIGVVAGALAVLVRSRIDEPVVDTALSFAVPFVAFLPAQALGASGLVASVAAGLVSGFASARYIAARSRTVERVNWRTVQFVVENAVFLLMGAQVAPLVSDLVTEDDTADGLVASILIALAVVVLALVIRAVVVALVQLSDRRERATAPDRIRRWTAVLDRTGDAAVSERRRRALGRRIRDRRALLAQRPTWRGGGVVVWAGMRGVVTLAGAQSIPSGTPHRAQLVFIAFVVAVTTLLVQGGTLPAVIRLAGVRGSDAAADRRALAQLVGEMTDAGLGALPGPDAPDDDGTDPTIVERVRRDTERAREITATRADDARRSDALDRAEAYWSLKSRVISAEREALLEARSRGDYPSRIVERAERLLDAQESRPGTLLTDHG